MPSRQSIWQLRTWSWPSIATRHSKQIPIPHRGPRSSPDTERRKVERPASKTAAATVEPRGTRTVTPFTFICTASRMSNLHIATRRVRLNGNGGRALQKLVEQQATCCQRSGDAEALVAGGKIKILAAGAFADHGQLVRGSRPKAGPAANGRHLRQFRQVFAGASQHAGDDVVINSLPFHAKLPRRADKQLAGDARLYVEGERLGGEHVRALQVAKFHQLVPNEAGIAVGDDEVAFARAHFQAGREFGSPGAGGINHGAGTKRAALLKNHAIVADFRHSVQIKIAGMSPRLAHKEAGGAGGVDDQVFRD